FREAGAEEPGFCAIGSVKTNIGHLDAASGVAGLIKAVLALKHRQIPPSLHFAAPNPQIDFARSPFYVNARLADWPADSGPRRAGVSSFGIGGTNAHAILEEAPPEALSGPSRRLQLLLLSARTPGALEQATENLAGFLAAHPDASLPDVAWTLQTGRKTFEHRRMLVCEGVEDAVAALRGPAGSGRVLTRRQEAERRPVAFLFPGQGAQHPGMGRDLYEDEPVFRAEIDACAERLLPLLGRDLREILASPELQQTRFAQPALFAVELALARLWISWGLRPEAMLGHSLGEYVAACLAGVFSAEDALELVAARGALMQELPPGAMLAVELSEHEIEAFPDISLAAVNAPNRCVLSGSEAAIAGLEARLAEKGVQAKRLRTSHAFHSAMMDPVLDAFAERVARVPRRPPQIPFLSNLTGTWITAAQATDPGYWARHLRGTVRFSQGLTTLLAGSNAALLEVGPGSTLADLARRQSDPVSSLPRAGAAEAGSAALLGALGRLWLAGVDVDWPAFHAGERRRRVPLPTYPFERRRYWIEAPRFGPAGIPGVDRRRFMVVGGEEASRPEAGFADPRIAEALERLLLLDPRIRVVLPLAPEAQASPDPEAPAGHPRPDLPTSWQAPGNDRERQIARVWQELLGIQEIGVHDDFFALGGDSLLATRLASRLRETLGREVPLELVFAEPTVARLALRLETEELAACELPPIERAPREDPLPLSFAQQRLLFLHMLAPGDVSYNMPLGLRLKGPLEPARLESALRLLVARHEVLRTTFSFTDREPIQCIGPAGTDELPLLDLSGLPGALAERETLRAAEQGVLQPFDLLCGPVLRAMLLRLKPEEHVLVTDIHHVAVDGWSWAVFSREMVELYEKGEAAGLPALPVQYADFAVWQRRWLQGEALNLQLEYWRERLAGLAPVELPADRPRPPVRSGKGAALPVAVERGPVEGLRALGQQEDATLFMSLLAVFAVLVRQRTKKDRPVVGTDIANRTRAELEGLIGLFVNQLVLSFDLAGNPTFREVLRQVRRDTLEAYRHQDAPFDRLVELLRPERDVSRTPLFQLKLVLQNTPFAAHHLPELSVAPLEMPQRTAKFDLLLNLVETGDGLSGFAEYSTDLFEAATIARLLDDFALVLKSVAGRPDLRLREIEAELDRLELRDEEERDRERRSLSLARARSRARVAVVTENGDL
ncbi:MAG TPA: condensation domain-containing protein, partial [Thermoanaerobaculia bacterium]|nr:condensation domain-containing protein [Thermoanaerobaculia bacterium]